MTYIIEYIQHTFDMLVDKLGEDHVYIRTIESIINEAAGKDREDIPDSCIVKARQLINTICHDPVIQKMYFPINIDIEMQARHRVVGTRFLRTQMCAQRKAARCVMSIPWHCK